MSPINDVLDDEGSISVSNFVHSILVVPFDAPIPKELEVLPIQTGHLLTRLACLVDHEIDSFEILPLKGDEMMQLSRIWPLLVTAKKIFVLRALPGARYDVLFDQGVRAVGIPLIPWPVLASSMERAALATRREKDSKPWNALTDTPMTDEQSATTVARLNKSVQRKPAGPPLIQSLPTPKPPTDSEIESEEV